MPTRRRVKVLYVILTCFYMFTLYTLMSVLHIDPRFPSNLGSPTEHLLRTNRKLYSMQRLTRERTNNKGTELARTLASRCANLARHPEYKTKQWHIDIKHNIAYCPIEKIGSTFWRRVFFMTVPKNANKYNSPYEVPILDAIEKEGKAQYSRHFRSVMGNMNEVFLFVREPYSRLLSAYVDKLLAPNPLYWKWIGAKSIGLYRRTAEGYRIPETDVDGHDVTFEEFVRYARAYETIGKADAHVVSIHRACKPCLWNYTYVGKMETFKEDALYILEKMGFSNILESLGDKFALKRVHDSVSDSINSVFGWKENITRIISWEKALKRVWLKMQLQGIISADIGFDAPSKDWESVTDKQMIAKAIEAHRKSDPAQLRKQKDQVKREAFSTVALRHIHTFRKRFLGDFVLFDYDDAPDFVFNRHGSPTISLFNYSHLN